jgi:apolipoprotein D and lipocalin family protein
MKQYILLSVLGLATICSAQIPSIGWCPDKRPMPGFDMDKYLGTWYEQERYFTVLEAGSRCARTNYTKAIDGRVLVTNEITNRLTGIKRVLDGEIREVPKLGEPSSLRVKYSTLPLPMETQYTILDTDYNTYSVVWACSSFGPLVNSQSAWVMTRDRLPSGTILQKAYGILDKHKITRTFFVKADQEECTIGDPVPADPAKAGAEEAAGQVAAKGAVKDEPVVAAAAPVVVADPVKEVAPVKEVPVKEPAPVKEAAPVKV